MPRIQHNDDAAEIEKLRGEVERLRAGIRAYLDGNYDHPRRHRYEAGGCKHGRRYYEECCECDVNYFKTLIGETVYQQQMPPKCDGCGTNYADPPSKLCPGCQAYQDHQR